MVGNRFDEDLASLSEEGSEMDEGMQSSSSESISRKDGDRTADETETTKLALAQTETAFIQRLRILVFLVLAAAAATVSVTVFNITSDADDSQAEGHFDATAEKIIDAFHSVVYARLSSIASMGIAIIAHGMDHDGDWPFVTLSSFQHRAMSVREQSGAIYLHLNPIVRPVQRSEWETFVAQSSDAQWVSEAIQYQTSLGMFEYLGDDAEGILRNQVENRTEIPIWHYDQEFTRKIIDPLANPFFPTWQVSPLFFGGGEVNENVARSEDNAEFMASYRDGIITISDFFRPARGGIDSPDPRTSRLALMLSTDQQRKVSYEGDPLSKIILPIFDNFNNESREVVAILSSWIRWEKYFEGLLARGTQGIRLVLSDSCSGRYSFEVNGPNVELLGWGSFHDRNYDSMKRSTSLAQVSRISDGTKEGIPLPQDMCPITLEIYPSALFFKEFESNTPFVVAFSVAAVFLFTVVMFLVYDCLVERRQTIVLRRAQHTSDIVTSLFPEQVADRLIANKTKEGRKRNAQTNRLKSFLSGSDPEDDTDQPIADLFLHCTVLFSDIAGFTAWSSTRDPAQVFILLQTIYQNFDTIAKRRRVFKVETIGDSYVAVTGLPEPQANHAVIMARFAAECMTKMNQLVAELESRLGPDTGDLTMRVGLHSGPVTAGVLRGDRARFQLFGDTVNTAARMESTGIKNKIQISQATRDLLVQAKKEHWVRPREETVQAKGKGTMQTYWLNPNTGKNSSTVSATSASEAGSESNISYSMNPQSTTIPTGSFHSTAPRPSLLAKQERLIDWITDILREHLKDLLAQRRIMGGRGKPTEVVYRPRPGCTCPMDEMVDIINFPSNPSSSSPRHQRRRSSRLKAPDKNSELDPEVSSQLRQYVSIIASAYNNSNPFHNFEHACHVTMAVNKFLKQIRSAYDDKNADEITTEDTASLSTESMATSGRQRYDMYEYSYGMHSDPLTVFALVLSGLIHDVDHRGLTNVQMMQVHNEMALHYKNQSIAEQNSIDIAWNLLLTDPFGSFRNCLFVLPNEMDHFRQILVNAVMATDIFDVRWNDLRKQRWHKAFDDIMMADGSHDSNGTSPALRPNPHRPHHGNEKGDDSRGTVDAMNNLRATIVMEYIVQASDISHTMQHWHIYQKWNRRLFQEMVRAYMIHVDDNNNSNSSNRSISSDIEHHGSSSSLLRSVPHPAVGWYENELKFFDDFVIPLAQRLNDCQILGKNDECLSYARKNRMEWAEQGEQLVQEMMEQHDIDEGEMW